MNDTKYDTWDDVPDGSFVRYVAGTLSMFYIKADGLVLGSSLRNELCFGWILVSDEGHGLGHTGPFYPVSW